MRIGIIGWYGHDNAGDERLLYSLKRFFDGNDFLVVTGFDDAILKINELNQCDYVLIGGGGLILRGFGKYCSLIKSIKPKLSCVGISIEAVHKDNVELIQAIVNKSEYIYVRDEKSKKLLEYNTKVIVGPDLSFLYPYDPIEPPANEFCGVNLRPWFYANVEYRSCLYYKLLSLDKKYHKLKKYYPFQKWQPENVINILNESYDQILPIPLYTEANKENDISIMSQYFENVPVSFSQDDYLKIRYIIGMRLHSVIFACQMGIPFISLSYQPKNEEFCRSIGMNTSIEIFNLSGLKEKIMFQQKNYYEIRERLLQFTKQEHIIASEIMHDLSFHIETQ